MCKFTCRLTQWTLTIVSIEALKTQNEELTQRKPDNSALDAIKDEKVKLSNELEQIKSENTRLQAEQKDAINELNLLEQDVFTLLKARVCVQN